MAVNTIASLLILQPFSGIAYPDAAIHILQQRSFDMIVQFGTASRIIDVHKKRIDRCLKKKKQTILDTAKL